jgi:hypothetical protein
VAAHPNDLTGITNCRNVVCGQKNASSNVESSSSSSSSPTASSTDSGSSSSETGSGSSSSSGGSGAPAETSSPAVAALNLGKNYGTGALAAGLFAIFGLAL